MDYEKAYELWNSAIAEAIADDRQTPEFRDFLRNQML